MYLGGRSALSTPPVVKNLIILNVLVFFAQMFLPRGLGDVLTSKCALYFWESKNFYPFQFVTSMFLHGDMGHIFFNMFALWMFGRVIEVDLGSKRFLTFYIICGIGASLFYSFANWLQIEYLRNGLLAGDIESQLKIMRLVNIPSLGASGAVYGLLLAFGMLHPNARIMLLLFPVPIRAKYFVMIFFFLEILSEFTMTDNIAHLAHVGGMIWGFMLLRLWKKQGKLYY